MDINVRIVRLEHDSEGSFGVLLLNDKVFCVTLELPWLGNAQTISSIPAGVYTCSLVSSPLITRLTKGVWEKGYVVNNVPNRSAVMIHPGNTDDDTHGCILVAQGYGKLRGERAILNSGATFNEFMTVMHTNSAFSLDIRDYTHIQG